MKIEVLAGNRVVVHTWFGLVSREYRQGKGWWDIDWYTEDARRASRKLRGQICDKQAARRAWEERDEQ